MKDSFWYRRRSELPGLLAKRGHLHPKTVENHVLAVFGPIKEQILNTTKPHSIVPLFDPSKTVCEDAHLWESPVRSIVDELLVDQGEHLKVVVGIPSPASPSQQS